MTAVSFELSEFHAPPTVDEAEFDAMPWQCTTATVRAGDFPFRVRVSHPELAAYVDSSSPACRSPTPPMPPDTSRRTACSPA